MLRPLIDQMEPQHHGPALRVLQDEAVIVAPGSSHNHQAWRGGYLDHVTETMRIAGVLHSSLEQLHVVPFTLASTLVVLFVHDLEKPWKTPGMTKTSRMVLRCKKIEEFGFHLSRDEENAVMYVEGEGEAYSPLRRVMGPLAAFCHGCDVLSARMWFDHPAPVSPGAA